MRWLSLLSSCALVLSGLVFTASSAFGHARYERSDPADGAVVPQSPPRVDVYFTQELSRSGGLPELKVVNDVGDAVQSQAVLDDADRTHMYAELPPSLPPGRYTVIWHTLSDEDGEEAEGAFHFFVGASPTGNQSPTGVPTASPATTTSPRPTVTPSPPTPADADDDDGLKGGTIVGVVAGSVLAGVAAGGSFTWFALRRRA